MAVRLVVACLVGCSLVASVAPSAAAQGGTWQSFCASEPAGATPVVYVSQIFDTHVPSRSGYRPTSLSREFEEYVKGRYGYKPGVTNVATCNQYQTAGQAEEGKALTEKMAKDVNHPVVPVDWTYSPDSDEIAFAPSYSRDARASRPPSYTGPTDRGYCVSDQIDIPLYVAGVIAAGPAGVNLAQWQIGYNKFLSSKYGTKGFPFCTNGTAHQVERQLRAREDGARAAGRKIVDTGWKPSDASVSGGPKPDADPQPAPAAAPAAAPPAAPPANARDLAAADGDAALTVCNNDRMMSGAFDCYAIQRAVYNYRMQHASATTEPTAQLLDKVDCSGCTNDARMELWSSNRAQSNGFSAEKSKCVGERFRVSLKAKPSPNRVTEFFNAAMKACPK